MVLGHIENRGHFCTQAVGGFQLEAGQFQHIQPGLIVKQFQRRHTQVAADARVHPAGIRYLTQQGGHCALGIGAGDGHQRLAGRTGEQLNVADHFFAIHYLLGNGWRGYRHARAHDQATGLAHPAFFEATGVHFQVRKFCAQGIQPGRLSTGVNGAHGHPLIR